MYEPRKFLKINNFSKTNFLRAYLMSKLNTLTLTSNHFEPMYVVWDVFIWKTNFVNQFFTRNENMWGDGFLFDFLQKKTADAWVRRFVIYTGFLFSERVVFEFVVRIYLDNMIWVLHSKSMTESSNVSEMLTTTVFLIVTLVLVVVSTLTYSLI